MHEKFEELVQSTESNNRVKEKYSWEYIATEYERLIKNE